MTEQPPYSLLTRGIEADVLPTCARYGMGVIPYSPLAGGWLSGRYRRDSEVTGPVSPARQRLANRFDLSLEANQRKLDAAEKLAELADQAGMTLIEMAIAFVLRHPAVTAAFVGPRTMEHLESQLSAADIELSDDVLDRIDQIVPPGTTHQPRRRRLGQSSPGGGGTTPLDSYGAPGETRVFAVCIIPVLLAGVIVAVVMRMVTGAGTARTGRVCWHSTAGLAVVAAAGLVVTQLDQGVGRGQPQLGGERAVVCHPV